MCSCFVESLKACFKFIPFISQLKEGSDVVPMLLNDFKTNHFLPLDCKQGSYFILFLYLSQYQA